jgi:Cd2+/Zn2+-exporting ATPase
MFDENFLMSLATLGAVLMQDHPEAAAVMLFYQVGELFQSYAVDKSRRNITDLMDIRPDFANRIEPDGSVQQTNPEKISGGDTILVRPGEKIPLDGLVLEGRGTLNTSALTGESAPRNVPPGVHVISGCVNNDGLFRVQVTKPFAESTVSQILNLVEDSGLRKAKAENFITKFARHYTPIVCIGALTFLVISCPCALVISIPLTFFGGIGGASRRGILVKGGNYLEALAQTKTIVFDKTGTLTQGGFQVTSLSPAAGCSEENLLELAALAEQYSNHPNFQKPKRRLWQGDRPGPGNGRAGDSRPWHKSPGRPYPGAGGQRSSDGAGADLFFTKPLCWDGCLPCGRRRVCRVYCHS